ncbi:Transcription factor-like protein DPB [Triticum urartu]|uniref:Transcription factor-like protein DPB n=1 Tax=Triticum urartu TaxID=4572 RepID=M8ABY6_TRIUA|nr:Transcription factor-like protein DPB [Triticum urartu]
MTRTIWLPGRGQQAWPPHHAAAHPNIATAVRRHQLGINFNCKQLSGNTNENIRHTTSRAEASTTTPLSQVCEKVEAKGRTTYNEFDEKNIRRRVYDAFNVLIALRVIAKEKKEIRWMGLSNYRYEKIKKLEEVRKELVNKIRNKKALLQEIEKQFDDLQNIKLRNQTLESSAENVNGIRLPFVLVKTSRKARVEIEISDDSKFAHFEFNGAPFTLHDDLSILEGVRRNSIGRAGRATLH